MKAVVTSNITKVSARYRRMSRNLPGVIDRATRDLVTDEALPLFEKTVQTWQHRPRFLTRKTARGYGVEVDPLFPFEWVNQGTRAHVIEAKNAPLLRFAGPYHPKTKVNYIGSLKGVYRSIVLFERSLLPRGKASNTLTALTVKGESDMATSKEKSDALAALLGDPKLAEAVIQQAEQTEKAAEDSGLKYKEQQEAEKSLSGTPTAVPATGASGINPIGMESNGKKAKKAEGEPGEEAAEPKAEAEAEPDWEAYAEKMKPHLMKMIEEKMRASAKETAEKEAGLNAKIAALETSLKELTGDVPRGLQSFRAALAPETILKEFNVNSAATQPGSLDDVIDRLAGIKK